eukprot:TRINITY_DN5197_c0_g1_i2.p1 TRINITY_DN5197_c0_g1~~TRINITY_DN5197_c0_g1_i2.p1  ORF type:complete len:319 (-),score=84.09 TRINITY_DN5197_c0_g1_i2:221-1153(-)
MAEDGFAIVPSSERKSNLKYHTNGAVMTPGAKCTGGCDFAGGFSGKCSVCWKKLSKEEKLKVTKEAEELAAKQQALEAEEDAERERAKRKRAEDEIERKQAEERNAKRQATDASKAKSNGDCYCICSNATTDESKSFHWTYSMISQDKEVELWSCGLINTTRTTDHSKHKENPLKDRIKRLQEVQGQLISILQGVGDESSEGDEPYVGFFIICTGDMAAKPSFEVLKELIPDLPEELGIEELPFTKLFPSPEKDTHKKKQAAELLESVCQTGTGFILYPDTVSVYCGPILFAGRTADGDMVGVRGFLTWT